VSQLVIHIEHYYNEFDFVAGLGVANTQLPPGLDTRFFGQSQFFVSSSAFRKLTFSSDRVPEFMRKGATGHLLNQHYITHFLNPKEWGQGGLGGRLHGYLDGKAPSKDS
jgi:hypothetical protein